MRCGARHHYRSSCVSSGTVNAAADSNVSALAAAAGLAADATDVGGGGRSAAGKEDSGSAASIQLRKVPALLLRLVGIVDAAQNLTTEVQAATPISALGVLEKLEGPGGGIPLRSAGGGDPPADVVAATLADACELLAAEDVVEGAPIDRLTVKMDNDVAGEILRG